MFHPAHRNRGKEELCFHALAGSNFAGRENPLTIYSFLISSLSLWP